jgi:hypothetical protein
MAQPTRAGAGTLRLADQRAVEIQASTVLPIFLGIARAPILTHLQCSRLPTDFLEMQNFGDITGLAASRHRCQCHRFCEVVPRHECPPSAQQTRTLGVRSAPQADRSEGLLSGS